MERAIRTYNAEPAVEVARQELGSMPTDFVHVSAVQMVNVIDLTLPESLDSEEFDRLNASLLQTLAGKNGARWVLDLSAVNYMGSSVLGLMINIRQQIKTNNGRLVLSGLSTRLTQTFHTCCLERLFTIAKTREEAAKALGAK